MKLLFLGTLLCLALAHDVQAAGRDPGYAFDKKVYESPFRRQWMANVPNNKKIFVDLTIPGTHDSGSYVYKGLVGHQCQSQDIRTQLNAGVRFLDIRIVCIDKDIRVVHGILPTKGLSLSFADILSDIVLFLTQNPTEVVIVRLGKEDPGTKESRYRWHQDVYDNIINGIGAKRDFACRGSLCEIGPSRGKIIFLNSGADAPQKGTDGKPGVPFLGYYAILEVQQDDYKMTSIAGLFYKWTKARSLLINASNWENRKTGVINYFSGASGATPSFIASGQSSPPNGIVKMISTSWSECSRSRDKHADFPRGASLVCGKHSNRPIYYTGTNNLLYSWLSNGKLGNPQSRVVPYTWPRHLGILALDFPDNSVLDEIVAVNFVTSSPFKGTRFIEYTCEAKCPSCVAGDAPIDTSARGVVSARDVVVGDRIPGMQSGEWCEVVAAARVDGNGTAYGNFTSDHLIVEQGGTDSASHIVKSSGADAAARSVDLVNIATTCPATRMASGELFTPLSTVFCPKLTWAQYIPLYSAIMRIVGKTGAFWFDPATYINGKAAIPSNSPESSMSSSNADAEWEKDDASDVGEMQPWSDGLPDVCTVMLECVVDGKRCNEFEVLAADWIARYVPAPQYARVMTAYPNLGDPGAQNGTLTADVAPSASHRWLVPAIAGGGAVALVAVAAAVFALCWRKGRSSRNGEAKNEPTSAGIPTECEKSENNFST